MSPSDASRDLAPPVLRDDDILRLQAAIAAYAGLRADERKVRFAVERAWPQLVQRGVHDPRTLAARLDHVGSLLWPILIPHLTVNETYFMRERGQLDDLKELILPKFAASARPISVLSAACATGEEAYSLAIQLAEAGVRGSVTGIDIDPKALERATQAIYTRNSFRVDDERWRQRHFENCGDGQWRPLAGHRRVTAFKLANLLRLDTVFPPGSFDVIFCRNVLIYFERKTQLDVVHRLRRLLAPGGQLFLGHAEVFAQGEVGLERVTTERATRYVASGAP